MEKVELVGLDDMHPELRLLHRLAAIGIPAKHDPDYHIALSAASGLDVPRVPAPPLGGGQANRAARREWRALIRVWERANAKALAKLRVRWEGQRK